jgi:hypothetical protein
MFSNFIDVYYKQTFKLLGLKNEILIVEVDFHKPWWAVYSNYKSKLLVVFLLRGVYEVTTNLLPLFLAYAITSGSYNNYLLVLALMAGLVIEGILMELNYTKLEASIIGSVQNAANKFFLTVDPNYHTTRSSGQIISKVTRGFICL